MFRRILSVLAVSGSLAQASTGTVYSFKTEGACSTLSGSGGSIPQSLPTSRTTSTVSSTITSSEVTVASVVKVTVEPVTTTLLTSLSVVYGISTTTLPTATSWQIAQSTVATATWPKTVCTNDVTPSTVTEYSGSYTPIPGQVTTIPTSYPSQVVCATGVTWFVMLQPTATSGVTTETVTPTSTIRAITTTTTSTYFYNATVWATTLTSTTTSYRMATSVATISTACEATTTTTYAAKCAPTNVIAGVDDHGLVSGKYAQNNTVIYIPDEKYNDPSTCCQLCQDNKGCAGMMAGPSGFCGLLYVGAAEGGPACDFVFSYQTQSNVFPLQGLWVQSGCGEIDYTGPDGV
ncbi:uncharacterized protein GGS22DRAFT_78012 [Annulohypoxylon maeteangense]|uniref:uncharacterized protein n=1 Tax=Annulohypoxylon maeteangense TaxID=1927788 RepID=UPI002008AD1C|nr:uncharacterized protein GGS22DRAFT_78012 [Annulohypoxylon maeteangense]KAI0880929.1 hypothetical protein GGS22DRAFT_78012 [Annulohypoxylon maeteangense]